MLDHIALVDGPGVRVEEADAEGIGREVSSYYISKMSDIRLLERAAGSRPSPATSRSVATARAQRVRDLAHAVMSPRAELLKRRCGEPNEAQGPQSSPHSPLA